MILQALRKVARRPKRQLDQMVWLWRGLSSVNKVDFSIGNTISSDRPQYINEFSKYFDAIETGHGLWKWRHYFEIYDRHFARFRDSNVNIMEVGIYSGGSLGMWKAYFGSGCKVYGVDIEESCKNYEDSRVEVFIGDQASRSFWRDFRKKVPKLDIIVDDGGHEVEQQVVTLEEMFVHLRPGGVYLCEDVHGITNKFAAYISGLSRNLNDGIILANMNDNERRSVVQTSDFQSAVHSIHIYPFVVVIEKRDEPIAELSAPKHGTQWQPFLK